MKAQYGIDSMPETGENVAEEFQVARKDQDAFALRSQQRAGKAAAAGYFAEEIVPVEAPGGKAGPIVVDRDEHPRPDTTLENLAKLKPIVRNPGTITAGNASGVNDALPAVMVPALRTIRLSLARFSAVVSGPQMFVSVDHDRAGLAARRFDRDDLLGEITGGAALPARCCERSAKASWSLRAT